MVASVDNRIVAEKEFFQLKFTLKNGKGRDFRGPVFNNFIILNHPSRFLDPKKAYLNEKGEMIFIYSLMPKGPGKFKLPSASILVDRQRIYSNVLEIEVHRKALLPHPYSVKTNTFVRAEANADTVYLGQQIVLNYKLYTETNVETFYFSEEPSYRNFYKEDTHHYKASYTKEVINGVSYHTKVLKKIVLFPQRIGSHIIEPMSVRLGVRGNSLFTINRFTVQTNPVEIEVLSLLDSKPDGFTGAVGNYKMEATISTTELSIDEDFTLTLSIEGDGDIKRLQAPSISFPEHFELFEPKTQQEGSKEIDGIFIGKKTISYQAVPTMAGKFTISPTLTFFSPAEARFITLSSDTFQLNVWQSLLNTDRPKIKQPQTITEDLRPIKTYSKLYQATPPLLERTIFFLLIVFPILILLAVFYYQRVSLMKQKTASELAKKNRAKLMAVKHMALAKEQLILKKHRAFYDEISKALLGYICLKLGIPLSELTHDTVKQHLQSLNVNEPTILKFMSILQTTEMVLFAGKMNIAAMQQTYQQSLHVIRDIEFDLPEVISAFPSVRL